LRGQAFGREAKEMTSERALGKIVRVRMMDTDRYGRMVARVLLTDGRGLNEAVVRAGLAWWYRDYAPEELRLERLEEQARRAGRGLWPEHYPSPPLEVRQ
jgi:endonuclease YncB( thermonuclease family)